MSKKKTGNKFIFIGSKDKSILDPVDELFTLNKPYKEDGIIFQDKKILRLICDNGKTVYIERRKFKNTLKYEK